MLIYNSTHTTDAATVCCISGKGSSKKSFTSLQEAGKVANKIGAKVYQCIVVPGTFHITSRTKTRSVPKTTANKMKDLKRVKRQTAKELNALLTEVEDKLQQLYRLEEEAQTAWTQEQLDEFYRREQELLDTENILIEELEEEDVWMRAMKSKH